MTNQDKKKAYNEHKFFCRLSLGFSRLWKNPFLIALFIIGTIASYHGLALIQLYASKLDIPPIFEGVWECSIMIILIVLPVLLFLAFLEAIGEFTARKDEQAIAIVFSDTDLRNGHPILLSKRKDKETGIIIREFFSLIPKERWLDNSTSIAEKFNEHFCREDGITYGGFKTPNGRKIRLRTMKGIERQDRGSLYDEEF